MVYIYCDVCVEVERIRTRERERERDREKEQTSVDFTREQNPNLLPNEIVDRTRSAL